MSDKATIRRDYADYLCRETDNTIVVDGVHYDIWTIDAASADDGGWQVRDTYISRADADDYVMLAHGDGSNGTASAIWVVMSHLDADEDALDDVLSAANDVEHLNSTDWDLLEQCREREAEANEVDDDYTGEVWVMETAHYYGDQTDKTRPVYKDGTADERTWVNAAEAREWIDEIEDESYVLDHNESSRPTYRIVEPYQL